SGKRDGLHAEGDGDVIGIGKIRRGTWKDQARVVIAGRGVADPVGVVRPRSTDGAVPSVGRRRQALFESFQARPSTKLSPPNRLATAFALLGISTDIGREPGAEHGLAPLRPYPPEASRRGVSAQPRPFDQPRAGDLSVRAPAARSAPVLVLRT